MRTLEDIRATLEVQPEPSPEHKNTTEVPVIGFGIVKVMVVGGQFVHVRIENQPSAYTYAEALDLAAALIYQAQKVRDR